MGKPGRHDSVKGFVAVEEAVCAESQIQWPIKMILAFSMPLAHSLLLACNTAIVLSGH